MGVKREGLWQRIMSYPVASERLQHVVEGIILALLTLVVYLLTINSLTQSYALIGLSICLACVLVFYLFFRRKNSMGTTDSRTFTILIFTFTTAILLWVGNTGWFFSPFFYLLYLVGISIAFLYSPSVSFTFILVLVGVLIPNIGSVNKQIDIVSLVALLCIIPLSYFLRREYLKRVEREKKILILEEEHKTYENKVQEILTNKIIKFGSELREPINDIKQMVLYSEKLSQKEKNANNKKMILASEKALRYLKHFEETTTGTKLVSSLS